MFLLLILGWLPWLLIGGGVCYVGLRLVRVIEGRSASAMGEADALRERVRALEAAVAEQSEELRRLAEGEQFTRRLLAERNTPRDVPRDAPPT